MSEGLFRLLIEQLSARLDETSKSIGHLRGGPTEVPQELGQKGHPYYPVRGSVRHGYLTIRGQYRKALADLVTAYTKNRKTMPFARVKEQTQAIIRSYFEKAYRYGMLDRAGLSTSPRKGFSLTQSQYQWLAKAASEEFGYFQRLLDDVRYNRSKMHYLARIDNYALSLDPIYDAGRVSVLPQEAGHFLADWVMDYEAEHCPSCLWLANHSPWVPENLPTTPRAGATLCMVGCKCKVVLRRVSEEEYKSALKAQTPKKQALWHLNRLQQRKHGTRRARRT